MLNAIPLLSLPLAPVKFIKSSTPVVEQVKDEKLSLVSDLKKLAELIPSKVSASSPEPAPSTVLIAVSISLAD